jgi:hypothetical protein
VPPTGFISAVQSIDAQQQDEIDRCRKEYSTTAVYSISVRTYGQIFSKLQSIKPTPSCTSVGDMIGVATDAESFFTHTLVS